MVNEDGLMGVKAERELGRGWEGHPQPQPTSWVAGQLAEARTGLTSDSNLHLGPPDLDRKVGLTDRGSGLSPGSGRGRIYSLITVWLPRALS